MKTPSIRRERGAVLMIAMILMIIISLVVATAAALSNTNLRVVGNVQYRSETVTAANSAIESLITSSFLGALNTTTAISVDLNKDGTPDYQVSVAVPQCPVRVSRVSQSAPSGYETTDGAASVAGTYLTDWELVATVADGGTGSQAVVREGVRIAMGEADYQTKVVSCGLTLFTS